MNRATQLNRKHSRQIGVDLFRSGHFNHSPFLNALSDAALSALTHKAKTITYLKKVAIVSANHDVEAFYIILSGSVRLFVSDEAGKEITLNVQEAGTYFGEVGLLSQESMAVSISTLQNTMCAVIEKNDFLAWLAEYPEVVFVLLGVLSQKIQHLTEKVKQMCLLDHYGRFAILLKEMAVAEGNVSVIYNKPSQEALASMVGASRETVNKLMTGLIKGGYIVKNNKNLVIHQKLPAIWQAAHGGNLQTNI